MRNALVYNAVMTTHKPAHALLAAAFCLAAAPLFAADGVLIVEKTTTSGNTKTNQIQIEKERMRAESDTQTVVFDGTKQVLWLINDGRKSYSEMTKADVDRMGGQLNDAMAKMQEQLKSLPPEQRAQIEAMMKGRGMPGMAGGAAAPKTEYRKTGTDKVGAWTCDKYEGTRGGQKVTELCTVDPKVLGLAMSDFQVSKQLVEFFGKLVPQGADRHVRRRHAGGTGLQRRAGPPHRVQQRPAAVGFRSDAGEPAELPGVGVRAAGGLSEGSLRRGTRNGPSGSAHAPQQRPRRRRSTPATARQTSGALEATCDPPA